MKGFKMQTKHYLVVTDEDTVGDAILQAADFVNSRLDEYPDTTFQMTGAVHKANEQWFSATGEDNEPFSLDELTKSIVDILSNSPFGTDDSDVTRALASRHRPDLKLAAQHMLWLYTTAGISSSNLNIWCDSIFEGELDQFGITNLTVEYESDPETTFMVELLATTPD